MKSFFLTLLLAASGLSPLRAQQAPVQFAAASYTHADTARVVHQIFKSHRLGSAIWTATGLLVGVQVLRVSNGIGDSQPGAQRGGITTAGVALGGVIPIGIGVGKLARFTRGSEKEVLRNFDQGKPLPPYVLSRLRTRYFAQ